MEKAIRILHAKLPEGAIQTATTDRGKELSYYATLEADLNMNIYFADPYSSWKSDINENWNGLLDEFFPKETKFDHVTSVELSKALEFINNRSRKCRGWKTAHEAFMEQIQILHLI
jgi:IS30 family transposase